MSTPFRLLIPRRLYDAMLSHAMAELPNECCGLLAGPAPALQAPDSAQVTRHYPLVNAAASPVEYLSDARSMFDAVRDIARQQIEILAVYHSHPTSDPVPSRTDLERNYGEEVVNLIISLKTVETFVRGWFLGGGGFTPVEFQICEET